jgi:hypothetical protein
MRKKKDAILDLPIKLDIQLKNKFPAFMKHEAALLYIHPMYISHRRAGIIKSIYKTRISQNNYSSTFISYDSDRTENDVSNNSSIVAYVFVTATKFEMGSGAMIYIPNFIKIGSGIQKLIDGKHRHTDLISLLIYFFLNMGSRLKTIQNIYMHYFLF